MSVLVPEGSGSKRRVLYVKGAGRGREGGREGGRDGGREGGKEKERERNIMEFREYEQGMTHGSCFEN